MQAGELSLTGWAQNQSDGSVVIEIEGRVSHIDAFIRAMQAVPRFDIVDIQAEDLPLSGTKTSFKILY